MTAVLDLTAATLILLGAALMAIAALGVARMPDLFARMQAASKTGTSGAGLILVGTALAFRRADVVAESFVIALFLLLTAPVAAHLLARAAYGLRVPLAPSTKLDELRDTFGAGSTTPGGTPGFPVREKPQP